MVLAEFEQLETSEDYEKLIESSVRGIPSHWPPEIAKQCLFSPTSSNGKRYICFTLCLLVQSHLSVKFAVHHIASVIDTFTRLAQNMQRYLNTV